MKMKSMIYMISVGLVIVGCILLILSLGIPYDIPEIKIKDGKLFINNQPFLVKGVCYEPVAQGVYYNGMDWDDESIYERDFPRILEMGFNTIRTYHNTSKVLFKQASMYGLFVCPTFLIDGMVNFNNEEEKKGITKNFISFVEAYKDEPSLLFWIIGNEQNYTNGNCLEWYSFANKLAQAAKTIDGSHPVAICEGDTENIGNIGNIGLGADDDSLSYIDLWACNVYRGSSFYDFFDEYKNLSNKALFISEYGSDSWHSNDIYYPEDGYENQSGQKDIDLDLWNEITSYCSPVIGGSVFAYTDGWWKDSQGNVSTQEYGGAQVDSADDGFFNEEFWGFMKITKDNKLIEKEVVSGFRDKLKIYVKPSNKGGDGTKENPYPSIDDAIRNAKPGDTIQLLRGIYILKQPLEIDKSITLLGNQENPRDAKIILSPSSKTKGYIIKIGNNSYVNLIGLAVVCDKPVFIDRVKTRVIIRDCLIEGQSPDPIIECNSFTQVILVNNTAIKKSSRVLAKDNSTVMHKGNKGFLYSHTQNAKIIEIPPCPSLLVKSHTIIHRDGKPQDIKLNAVWKNLGENKEYKLFYILINLPQGYAAAHKNGSLWCGGEVSVTSPNGNLQIMEKLAVHNWRDLLWVFVLKDEDNQVIRSYSFKPETIIKKASIDKILYRNNKLIKDIKFYCEWDYLNKNKLYTLSYILKGSSGNESAVDQETNVQIKGPKGSYSSGGFNLCIKDYVCNDLLWIVKIKDENGNIIDESRFIPDTILSQNVPTSIPTGEKKNYCMVYSIKGRVGDDSGGFNYLIKPDLEYGVYYNLIEADTGNFWLCAWDHNLGKEWTGDSITMPGINIFNPIIIKKDLTVYDYKKFLWVVEIRDAEGVLIDRSTTLSNAI